jgi:general secretion pathway protein J
LNKKDSRLGRVAEETGQAGLTTRLHISSVNLLIHKHGFTLLEVLISVAILSIVLTAVYSTFFLAQRAVDGIDESLVKLQEARRALDIMRCELDSSFFEKTDSGTILQVKDRDFYGKSASELTFTTFSVLRPGLSKVSYYIEERDGSLHLFKKIALPQKASEETDGVEIIENIEAFSIEAKYRDQWVKTWDTDINRDTPEEIRINFSFKLKDRVVALSDIATPRSNKPI